MKQTKLELIDIIQLIAFYCTRITSIVEKCGKNFDVFVNDIDKIDAAALNIIQIGERINSNLPDEIKAKAPEIPWRKYVAMRNKLAHAYFELDEEILWDSAINDVPVLYEFCVARLAEAGVDIPNLVSTDIEVQ